MPADRASDRVYPGLGREAQSVSFPRELDPVSGLDQPVSERDEQSLTVGGHDDAGDDASARRLRDGREQG